jgi:hypothetical protein
VGGAVGDDGGAAVAKVTEVAGDKAAGRGVVRHDRADAGEPGEVGGVDHRQGGREAAREPAVADEGADHALDLAGADEAREQILPRGGDGHDAPAGAGAGVVAHALQNADAVVEVGVEEDGEGGEGRGWEGEVH